MKLFKRKVNKCVHEWHFLSDNEELVTEYNGIDLDLYHVKYVYCYCPKCNTREKVTELEWKLRKREQEVILDMKR